MSEQLRVSVEQPIVSEQTVTVVTFGVSPVSPSVAYNATVSEQPIASERPRVGETGNPPEAE